ncbi:MAG TPA: glycosyltransferase [Vicinamibacterales bacterium]|nr:glycosyltransferase [Vicinamibacterales bacterium]
MPSLTAGLVSTIIPVYQRPGLLEEAVASVLAQTYRPIEILIVDDGSTDATGDVGRRLASEHPNIVRYYWQPHAVFPASGWTHARNRGLAEIRGEFVQFLDSDDLLLPRKFERQVAGLRAHPECGISYCFVREYPIGTTPVDRPARRTGITETQLFPKVLDGKFWPAPAPLYRRDVVDANGLFGDYSAYEDWEYECRAAARGVRLHHCREFLADKRATHLLEQRPSSVPAHALGHASIVFERVLGYARTADVGDRVLARFATRLFRLARRCAVEGHPEAADRLLVLSASAASVFGRGRLLVFAALRRAVGLERAAAWTDRAVRSRPAHALVQLRRWPARASARWRYRLGRARQLMSTHPPARWPLVLGRAWMSRQSRATRQR